MNKPLAILYTGGTIGMIQEASGSLLPSDDPQQHCFTWIPELASIAPCKWIWLENLDSSNLTPHHWEQFAKAIHDRYHEGYAGFVVLHGTDTLAYSAAALSLALGREWPIPVILTGAQTPPSVWHGDGKSNLLRAVKVALSDLAEVAVVFGDEIFRGEWVEKAYAEKLRAFHSAGFPLLGTIDSEIRLASWSRKRPEQRPSTPPPLQATFSSKIVEIYLTPGLSAQLFFPLLQNPSCQGIILMAFGMGNIPTTTSDSWIEFIQTACQLEKPLLLISQCPYPPHSGISSYDTGIAAVRAGAIPVYGMTQTAVSVKLRWLLAQWELQKSEAPFEKKRQWIADALSSSTEAVYLTRINGV